MAVRGWQGPPVVGRVDLAQAYTGIHRLAAAERAGVPVPVVDVFELADAVKVDLIALVEECGALDLAMPSFCAAVPDDVREAYGLDAH